MRTLIRNPLLILGLTLFLVSCGSDPPTGGGGDGETPSKPIAVTPGNNQSGQETQLTLTWRSSDPNGDPLTYDLYFGASQPPPLLAGNLVDTAYTVTGLRSNCEYFWKVVASDPDGHSSTSRTYSFATTADFRFPLAVGNRWGYAYEMRITDQNVPDSIGPFQLIVGEATIEVLGDTVLIPSPGSTLTATVVEETIDSDFRARTNRTYVANTSDGMITYAYTRGSELSIGKASGDRPFLFAGERYASLEEILGVVQAGLRDANRAATSLTFEFPPVTALAYPLDLGTRWTYRDYALGAPWQIDKHVTAWEAMTTAAGKFDVYVVRWLYDLDHDGEWDDNVWIEDRIASEGLVARDIIVHDIVQVDPANPDDTLSVFDSEQSFLLTEIAID